MNFLRVIYRRASHAAASLPLCFARINYMHLLIEVSMSEFFKGKRHDTFCDNSLLIWISSAGNTENGDKHISTEH